MLVSRGLPPSLLIFVIFLWARPRADGNVPKGAEGTILIVHDEKNFIVEFLDTEGNTLNVLTVNESEIELPSSNITL